MASTACALPIPPTQPCNTKQHQTLRLHMYVVQLLDVCSAYTTSIFMICINFQLELIYNPAYDKLASLDVQK